MHRGLRIAAVGLVCALFAALLVGCGEAKTPSKTKGASTGKSNTSTGKSGQAQWVCVTMRDGSNIFGLETADSSDTLLVLDDAFFIAQGADQANVNLLRRFGKEIHQPLPRTALPLSSIGFIQPLKADSEALKAILAFDASNPAPKMSDDLLPADSLQAVFMQDGQVFFGNLSIDGDMAVLGNAHYMEYKDQTKAKAREIKSLDEVQLVPQAESVVGGTGLMRIPLVSVQYFQTLSEDSPVVKALSVVKK